MADDGLAAVMAAALDAGFTPPSALMADALVAAASFDQWGFARPKESAALMRILTDASDKRGAEYATEVARLRGDTAIRTARNRSGVSNDEPLAAGPENVAALVEWMERVRVAPAQRIGVAPSRLP